MSACCDHFDKGLAVAKLQLDAQTPTNLAAARAISDILIATALFLGREFDEGQAMARNLRAAALDAEGRMVDALDEIERALDLTPQSGGEGAIWTTLPLNAATLARSLGKYERAAEYLAIGLSRVDAIDDPGRAYALLRAASDLLQAQGRYLEARQRLETGVAALEAAGPEHREELAAGYGTLAVLELELGSAEAAARLADLAIDALPAADRDPPYPLLAAQAFAHWAKSADWQLLRARIPRLHAGAKDSPTRRVDLLLHLALVCSDRGRRKAAERLLGRTVASVDAILHTSIIQRIDVRRHHANALMEIGELDAAYARLSQAWGLYQRLGASALTLGNAIARDLGRLEEKRGDPMAAFEAFERALWIESAQFEDRVGSTLDFGDVYRHRDAVDALSSLTRLAYEIGSDDVLRRARQAALASRGVARRALARSRRTTPDGVAPLLRERSEAARLVEWGNRLRAAGRAPPDLAALALRLVQLDAKLTVESLRAGVAGTGAKTEARTPKTKEAVIDFIVTIERRDSGREIRIYAFVGMAGVEDPKALTWRNGAAILADIAELGNLMTHSDAMTGVEKQIALVVERLSDTLWRPIEEAMGDGVRRLFIRPDGNLSQLPFAALHGADGRALCSRFDILLQGPQPPEGPGGESRSDYLVVGNPSPTRGLRDRLSVWLGRLSGRRARILPTGCLDHAAREARAVARKLDEKHGRGGKLLIGRAASRGAILNTIEQERPRILHFAMHAFALSLPCLGGSPRESAVVGHRQTVWRTGALCAGAEAWLSRTGPLTGDDDGLLLARDISLIDLRGVEIVVLAACESGLGDPALGEGALTLAEAFLTAGARCVIAATWSLDDRMTSDFMVALYSALLDGRSPESAVRYVQSTWSLAGRHPRLWAPYLVFRD